MRTALSTCFWILVLFAAHDSVAGEPATNHVRLALYRHPPKASFEIVIFDNGAVVELTQSGFMKYGIIKSNIGTNGAQRILTQLSKISFMKLNQDTAWADTVTAYGLDLTTNGVVGGTMYTSGGITCIDHVGFTGITQVIGGVTNTICLPRAQTSYPAGHVVSAIGSVHDMIKSQITHQPTKTETP